MEKRVIEALNNTWNAICYDWLELCDSDTVKRSEVFEAVVDADRLREYGRDSEAAEYFYSLKNNAQKKLFNKAFPYKSYTY